jgi:hypothetical protein
MLTVTGRLLLYVPVCVRGIYMQQVDRRPPGRAGGPFFSLLLLRPLLTMVGFLFFSFLVLHHISLKQHNSN